MPQLYRPIRHGVNKHAYITLWPIPRGPYVVALVSDDRSKPALNETTREFGERVRDRRVALGLSQEAAAVRCGIHWTQLGKVERGQRSLRLETIVKIADGLDIDAGNLVSGLPLPPGESD
ncbi:helix-turn-helix transcriptional regulator [Mycobacterium heidelbergense]|nr:helix-turn-helix transcriptional regulator [Mycobacterium heidelbergense]